MLKQLILYSIIGVLNTAVHWFVFYILFELTSFQSLSNLIAFLFAVVFSFYMNGKFTFKKDIRLNKMILYIFIMGGINFLLGFVSDLNNFSPFFTLIVSFILGPVIGFLLSKYLVFKG